MRSILLDNLPLIVALVTLYAIARTVAGRRTPATPCRHRREALYRGSWAVIEFRCLDCGRVRCLGHVWFGANNFKKRHAA